MQKIVRNTVISTLLLLLLISVGGYFVYSYVKAAYFVTHPPTQKDIEDQRFSYNKERLIGSILSTKHVPEKDLMQGFWYEYIDKYDVKHVFYFDLDKLAKYNLTDEQLKDFLKKISQSRIVSRNSMEIVLESELPSDLQFHNRVYSYNVNGGTVIDILALLETKFENKTYTQDDLFQLGYLYDLKGMYTKRDTVNTLACKEFKIRCKETIVSIQGTVEDIKGNAVQGAKITVLTDSNSKSVITNENGEYTISTRINKLEKIRIKAQKRNYSDGIAQAVTLSKDKHAYNLDTIVLNTALEVVTIDTRKKTVTGVNNYFNEKEGFIIKTKQSTYKIPTNAIVHENGTLYKGVIDVYLYEFTKDDIPSGLVNADTFDAVRGYAGDLMKTFGMPYIQFFVPDEKGREELHVLKSNPMTITYKIYHMDALYNNTDHIYKALTQKDMQFLYDASKKEGYTIDRRFLIDNNILRFPAFWVFDRKKGIWENIGLNVIDVSGVVQAPFYTINNN